MTYHQVPVTLRSRHPRVPPLDCIGLAPSLVSPLAVTRFALWNAHQGEWSVSTDDDPGFYITHRPTGFSLGSGLAPDIAHKSEVFDTVAEAWAVLLRCDPTYPAWPLAGENEAARNACHVMFKAAIRND